MFLDKFKNRYSYIFLSLCGHACFMLFCIWTAPELYTTYIIGNTQHSFGVAMSFVAILTIDAISICLFLFINAFTPLRLKTINAKLLNNKIINFVQHLGVSFILFPFLLLFVFLFFSTYQNFIHFIQK